AFHADGRGIAAGVPRGHADDLEGVLELFVRLPHGEPSVGEAADASVRRFGHAADPDRDGSLDGWWGEAGAGDRVEPARMGDRGLGPESTEELDLLRQSTASLIEWLAERFVLDRVPSQPD